MKIKKRIKLIPFVIFFIQSLYFNSSSYTDRFIWQWYSMYRPSDFISNVSWGAIHSDNDILGLAFCYYDTIFVYSFKNHSFPYFGFGIYVVNDMTF